MVLLSTTTLLSTPVSTTCDCPALLSIDMLRNVLTASDMQAACTGSVKDFYELSLLWDQKYTELNTHEESFVLISR